MFLIVLYAPMDRMSTSMLFGMVAAKEALEDARWTPLTEL